MNIVLSGIFYPVAILRYFEAALRRRAGIELVTLGTYTGNWIPWNGGMLLRPEYARAPDVVLPNMGNRGASGYPFKIAEAHLAKAFPDFVPDLWLQVDAGFYLAGKPSKGSNYIVATDPHCLSYDQQRGYADVFFCMQTPYMKSGDAWLPYAYDPLWHAPRPEPNGHEYDIGYIGAPYPDRVRLMQALQHAGMKILSTGYGPAYEEARQLQTQCRIGVNWSTRQDLCARVFELMAMHTCPLVNRVPDLKRVGFEEGKDYIGFDTLDEAVTAARNLLSSGEWQRIAEAAQHTVIPHTWDARVDQVLHVSTG